MAILLDGRVMSEELYPVLQHQVEDLASRGKTVALTVILVGDNPASQIYVRNKVKACERLGIRSQAIRLPAETTQQELEDIIQRCNQDPEIDGILLQLPLPKGLDEAAAVRMIDPAKDVDGFHVFNAGALFTGQHGVFPCTPKGIIYMLKHAGISLTGKNAVVIGRSNLVGKPVSMMLLNENCTVTICHSRTQNLSDITRQADILVVAIGKALFLTADMVKPGAAVIDVGINKLDGRTVGDVDFDAVEPVAGYITPVPGGVGKMTICMLMQNTIEVAARALDADRH